MAGARKHILFITRNLPPLIGGMERLALNLAMGLAQYCHVTVIGPTGCRDHLPSSIDVEEASPRIGPFIAQSTGLAFRACRESQFSLVIGGSGVVAPILWLVGKRFKLPTAVLIHGLDIVYGHPIYRFVFLPCIRRIDTVIANSSNTRSLAIKRDVPADRISIVNPGTEVPPAPGAVEIEALRKKYGITYEKFVLFVGRITPRKGLSKFITHCLPDILGSFPDSGLVIVGDTPANSLNKLSEAAEVKALAQNLGLSDRIKFLGHIEDEDLAPCFAAAAVQILPLVAIDGDVEGFGMVAVECAACGTPTVAFDLGGVTDAVSEQSGSLVSAESYTDFSRSVLHILNSGQPDAQACIEHAKKFEWTHYHANIKRVLGPILDGAS